MKLGLKEVLLGDITTKVGFSYGSSITRSPEEIDVSL